MINLNYIIWALIATLYAPTFYFLYRSGWEYIDYTHAYFILPVSLGLIWYKRAYLKKAFDKSIPTVVSKTGLALFIASAALFIIGYRNGFNFIATFSLIPLLFGLSLYLYGRKVTRALVFPFSYLFLLVPIPSGILDSITVPMRYGISVLTEIILKTFNYPITREGLLLKLRSHEIYMGAPCSGFRSLITMISLGLVYVYLSKNNRKNKILLLSSIIPFALIGNLIRVVSMCLVTFYFGDSIGQKYHDISGYMIFVFLILGLVGLEALLNKRK
ncbi:MAG: exosortase/archaeosortase family protein [Candidatus Omnitrophica bacterium]|nr:exosortase/archaeosortase family protein [Candidatus Omnitrophota bacterium]